MSAVKLFTTWNAAEEIRTLRMPDKKGG